MHDTLKPGDYTAVWDYYWVNQNYLPTARKVCASAHCNAASIVISNFGTSQLSVKEIGRHAMPIPQSFLLADFDFYIICPRFP